MAENFKIVGLLGEGGFGKVFLIESENDPSKQQALKLINILDLDDYTMKLTIQEIKLLKELEHQYVLGYIECFQQDLQICIVTEYCPNGDLGDYIKEQQGKPLEEARLIEWFRQIASAVEYLHSKNIIHRDLKAVNVFLDGDMNCKLGDFGIARTLDSATDMTHTVIGTPHYMSPEVFMAIPYGIKTDIWSLAVVIYELATLEKPFDAFSQPALLFKITHGQKPDMPTGYNDDFVDVLSSMMEKSPDDRPTASHIMQHRVFKKIKQPKPMPNLKTVADSVTQYAGPLDILSFVKTYADAKRPDVKHKPTPLDAVFEEENHDSPNHEDMDLITRTLSAMGHNTTGPVGKNPKAQLQHNIDMIRMYCLQVMGNDKVLFDKVSKVLDDQSGMEDIEEKLIDVLGHEKFGMCGVQMLQYKNYTFNLKHMKA